MSDRNNGAREPGPFHEQGRTKPRPKYTPGQRVFGFIVGLVFALAGLACVAHAVANLDDMKKPPKVVYQRGDMHDEGGYSLTGGFGTGIQVFFGMLFVGVGTGIATASATTSPGIRRGITAILALA